MSPVTAEIKEDVTGEEEQVNYGLTHNIDHKANPFHINFHEYADMMRDVRRAKGWRKKLFYIFGDPGKIAAEKKASEIGHDPGVASPSLAKRPQSPVISQ